tara:strand:- start:280 stop:630 length:351 start_codon:yes stop_codon:yes gene_type:complete
MYNELSNRQKNYIDSIVSEAPALGINTNKGIFSRAELRQVSMVSKGKKWIPNWITHDVSRRADRGVFHIPEVMDRVSTMNVQPGQGVEGDELADVVQVNDDMDATIMVSDDVMVEA